MSLKWLRRYCLKIAISKTCGSTQVFGTGLKLDSRRAAINYFHQFQVIWCQSALLTHLIFK